MSAAPLVLADFIGRFTVEGRWKGRPVEGRALLSRDQLVLAGPETPLRVPLDRVLDIGVGTVPDELTRYFDDCVTVAYRADGRPRVATIESNRVAIGRFSTLLFKTQLDDATVRLNHPARVGGRVAGDRFVTASLRLMDDAVAFTDIDTPFRIDLDSVIGFQLYERIVDDLPELVISIRHLPNDETMTTEATLESARRQNLLGRYLRSEYSDRSRAIRDTDLSTMEKRALVALHTSGAAGDVAGVLDVDPGELSTLLARLEGSELIEQTTDGVRITIGGRIMIGEFADDVDE